jgi:hypothetical protein
VRATIEGAAGVSGDHKITSGGRRIPPFKKRRVGHPVPRDGGKDSLLFAFGCCPVRFDLDCSLFSGYESKAADRSVPSTQGNPPDAPPIRALPGYGRTPWHFAWSVGVLRLRSCFASRSGSSAQDDSRKQAVSICCEGWGARL